MNKPKIAITPLENMSSKSLTKWLSDRFSESREIYKEASQYYNEMKRHHQHLSELMKMLSKKKKNYDKDHIENIAITASEVIDAIVSLRNNTFNLNDESTDIEKADKEFIPNEKDYLEAKKKLKEDIEIFMKNYTTLKSALGLKTQDDVANLTGIDRRYISVIEQGKHKPQFKTLKRLADAFHVEVSELIS